MKHLIRPEWFTDLPMAALLGMTVLAICVLVKGADWLVSGASGVARKMGVPEIIIGATIVSLGTTAPECAVSVMAAWEGKSGLALGNAVGSIVADTGLIFGLGCLLTVLPANRFLLSRQGWVQFGSAVLLAGLCYWFWLTGRGTPELPRWVGAGFLVLLAAYLAVSVKWSRQVGEWEPATGDFEPPVAEETAASTAEVPGGHDSSHARLLAMVAIGAVVVIFGSQLLIESVTVVARRLQVPDVVIAATLVSFGTSLPELVVGMTAIRRGHPELLVGNVIGADVLNVLFVIGASAVAAPLPIPEIFLYVHLPTMLLILVLFRLFIFRAVRRNAFDRWMGVPLIALYVAYVVVQFQLAHVFIEPAQP